MSGPPAISVVIPTLGRRPALDRCLAALARQDCAQPFELVLVADAAADRDALARRAAAHASLDTTVLQGPRPGASSARNAGWRAARAGLVLFVDDDVIAGPGLVGAHLAVHRAHPEERVGALGLMRWARSLRVTPFMRFLEGGIQFDYATVEAVGEVGWGHFYTCNVSVKRSTLESAGGFDEERFPFGYEDLDLALRIDAAVGGLRLLPAAGATAEHEHAMEIGEWRTRVGRIARAEHAFVLAHPEHEPWFHRLFSEAAARPRVRGRAARLAPYVPQRLPWLGERVHALAAEWYVQELAGPFLAAWGEARRGDVRRG